ncbi:hypothetical protein K402DRAFT_337676 [Aulographum hederae CBS 113979]|uniref:BTB domain-containing protein n=1 Tax=Aulographum hederae CBS 113979 TaxID=1176131 RepID=A0A6G1GSQ8_9PEZI|nr:hypothetical protein K402DRAFT_337676 [Aulographum hederae CBS 113979]
MTETFVLHKDLICHYSKYFKKALEGNFEEAKSGVVKLDDVDIRAFKSLVHWFYTQKIVAADSSGVEGASPAAIMEIQKALNPRYQTERAIDPFIKLYLLSDRLDIKRCRLDTFRALHDSLHKGSHAVLPSYGNLNLVWNGLPPTSGLRKYIIDMFGWYTQAHEEAWRTGMVRSRLERECLISIMAVICRKHADAVYGRSPPWIVDVCQYHEHESEGEKKACCIKSEPA